MATSKLMRAIRVSEFGGPSVLKLHDDVPVPTPGRKQVLIRVRASVGDDVTSFQTGDRVFSTKTETGGYAEYTVAAEDSVYLLPDPLSFNQGAAIGIPYFTAYRALFQKAHCKAGETVLVHGASGGVGVATCQIARAFGMKVLGTAGTPEGQDLVMKCGAHKVFNHREKDYIHRIMEATNGQGVNVIIEMLANVNLSKDLEMLTSGGRVAIVGSRGSIKIDPRDTMLKESSIIGVALFASTQNEEKEVSAAALLAGMESGWLSPVVGPQYTLEQAAKAHDDIIKSPGATGKMVLTIFLPAYNSLTDKHLTGYFNNPRIRRHLLRAGLITRSGNIVPEKEYKYKVIRREHQRRMRQCLSQAIFHKVLDIERRHRTEIKRKLEDFARKEHVNQIKPGSSLPSSAPVRGHRPVRLRPLYHSPAPSPQRPSHCCWSKDSSDDTDTQPNRHVLQLNVANRRHVTMPEFSSGISPYRLPVICNYMTPAPPPARRNEKRSRGASNRRTRGRSLRPTTAPDIPTIAEDSGFHGMTGPSNVSVIMAFLGKAVHMTPDGVNLKDEVKVFQQHCGGENVCVYRGKLGEREAFRFISRRHLGFPFSLTFFRNGIQVERLSSCCEFRYRRGSRLGGKHGLFALTAVDGASPCYRCIIALGLDKKPTPPAPKRLQTDTNGSSLGMSSKAETQDTALSSQAPAGPQSSQGPAEPHTVGATEREDRPEEDERTTQDDYEEDFEEEDERADEGAVEGRACIAGSGRVSSCSSEGGRDSPPDSKEDKMEANGERELEEKEGKKKSGSICSEDTNLFSGSRKEVTGSVVEEVKEAIENRAVNPYSISADLPEQNRKDQTVQDPEKGQEGDTSSPAPTATPDKQEHIGLGSAGETHEVCGSGEIETSLERVNISQPSEEKEITKWSVEKPENANGDTETARSLSVQEKLTKAVTKETVFSSELEASETSSDYSGSPTTHSDLSLDPEQTNAGVDVQGATEMRTEEKNRVNSDGTRNISTEDLAHGEGEFGTVKIGEDREEPAQKTEDDDDDNMAMEGGALGDGLPHAQEPMGKGEESKNTEQESENGSGRDLKIDLAEIERNSSTTVDGDCTGLVVEDGMALAQPPGLTLLVGEVGSVKKDEADGRLNEGTETGEVTSSIFKKQDVRPQGDSQEETMVEEAEEEEAPVNAGDTGAEVRPEPSREMTEISEEEEERQVEWETPDSVTEWMDGGKNSTEGENGEEIDTAIESPEIEEDGQDGVERKVALKEIDDTATKIEMSDDTNKEKLSQAVEGEENNKKVKLVASGINDDKMEVMETMRPGMDVTEASTGESEAGVVAEDHRTEVRQAKCDKMAAVLEDSEAADITVGEPDATEKVRTEGVWETESSAGLEDNELAGESKVTRSHKESEDMSTRVRDGEGTSAKLEGAVRNSETTVKRFNDKIVGGEAELEVRYAEFGSPGIENAKVLVGKEPKTEIVEEQTMNPERGGTSQPTEMDITSATTHEAETASEAPLNVTKGTLLEVKRAGRGIKNGDAVLHREVEEAVESLTESVTLGPAGTAAVCDDRLEDQKLWKIGSAAEDMKWGGNDFTPPSAEKAGKTETEAPGDCIDVATGDADIKAGKGQEVRAAVLSEAEQNGVNIYTKGLRDESHENSKLREKMRATESDGAGSGLTLEAEDDSQDHTKQRGEEIKRLDSEIPGGVADVTECDREGGEGILEASWVNADDGDPPNHGESSLDIPEEFSETAYGDVPAISFKIGDGALNIKSTTPEIAADGVKARLREERRKLAEDVDVIAEREWQMDAAPQDTFNAVKSGEDVDCSLPCSKTEFRNGRKFPPPLIRRSRSYALTIAREDLSLQTLAASDRDVESLAAYAHAAATITGHAFTASNQKLQQITVKDM
ncbi:hypothetical protein GJAV_G00120500 [Gymnothorax javanicus]|nr:hypothetical protein GJAV_G00120500 [Gymnothorax javanicus]